jgi:hypothetical protein
MLQVLLFSLLFGFSLHAFGAKGKPVFDLIEKTSHVLFGIVGMIMKVAPLGAFGAMAFTIGKLRHRHAAVARQADGHFLPDVHRLHLPRARHHRPLARLQRLEVHQVSRKSCSSCSAHVALSERAYDAARNDVEQEVDRAFHLTGLRVGAIAFVSSDAGSTFMPAPGCTMFTITSPTTSAMALTISK